MQALSSKGTAPSTVMSRKRALDIFDEFRQHKPEASEKKTTAFRDLASEILISERTFEEIAYYLTDVYVIGESSKNPGEFFRPDSATDVLRSLVNQAETRCRTQLGWTLPQQIFFLCLKGGSTDQAAWLSGTTWRGGCSIV